MLRVGLAIAFACTLPLGGWTPVVLFALATFADLADGPLARRAGGASAYGVLLDSGADVVFVLTALSTGVVLGRLSAIVPIAVACSSIPYLVATARRSLASGRPTRAYSAIGHWAGICNYALVGLLAGSVAMPATAWRPLLALGTGVVAALNLAAVALRIRDARSRAT